MSYKLEKTEIGTDIVISGWEEGILDNPYDGIYDMRNCDAVTIPGEVSVAMSTQANYTPISISNVTVTVDHTTSVFAYNGTIPLTIGTAITFTNSGGALPSGLSATQAYYVLTIPTGTTFTISMSAGGTQKLVTDNGTGTQTFSVINMGTPKEIIGKSTTQGFYFTYDNNGRVWGYLATNAGTYFNRWIYLNNLSSEISTGVEGNIITWRGYVFTLLQSGVGYVAIDNFNVMTLKISWHLNWKTGLTSTIHSALVSINDDSVYFCNYNYIGIIAEKAGSIFDPTSSSTYTYSDAILPLPDIEISTCLAELGSNLMIGGQSNYIYPWDRISPNFSTPIFVSENYITKMVTINTTMYIFCGYKGRIYITNGANATPFYKIAEYLSNTTNPYIVWTDATFNRNQLYFGFKVTTNSGTTINEYGGLWAIDVDSVSPVAPRMQNQMSYGTYNGYVSAICQFRGTSYSNVPNNDGYGLFVGWYSGSVGGMDITISTPYIGGQSYVITDPLPIGQYLTNKTIQGIEYKLAQPLATNESITIGYRQQMSGAFTNNPLDDYVVGSLSQWGSPKFEKSQWLQLQVILTSTATNPSYCRLREIRIHLQ